ncbi:hypothetical protein cypCar_00037833 [Cyprinus carpio]|nr:hypothetical protein cypCar_00037833 [Cyprinus carpio]
MQDEKEQEMIQSPVSPTDSTPSCSSQRELLTSLEPLDTEPNTQTIECINPHPRVKFSSDLPTYIDV